MRSKPSEKQREEARVRERAEFDAFLDYVNKTTTEMNHDLDEILAKLDELGF